MLGSGLSMPFGLPSVADLTEAVLDESLVFGLTEFNEYIKDHTESRRYLIPEGSTVPYGNILGTDARQFLSFVQNWIQTRSTFPKNITPNYEDIYDLIKQFHLSYEGEYENPALGQDFIKDAQQFAENHRVHLHSLLKYSLIFMETIVQYKLEVDPKKLCENRWVIDELLSIANSQDEIDVFSLNHDLIMESYCDCKGIKYDDGFYDDIKGLRSFDATRFYSSKAKLRIVKLHGSVDRYFYKNTIIRTGGKVSTSDLRGLLGVRMNPVCNVVTGKITKILEYSDGLQSDIHSFFRMKLATTVSTLIVIGYGFADKGINNALIAWYYSGDKELIVITSTKSSLIRGARLATEQLLKRDGNGRVTILEGGVENICTINALIRYWRFRYNGAYKAHP